jgi:hypothetical protein
MKSKVKDALIRCAIAKETIDYKQLIRLCIHGKFEYHVGGVIMDLLIDIGNEECIIGHPPINCLVVNKYRNSIPGERF